MIDALVQYLLEEIAMDGDEGTSIDDLATFIADFYSRASASCSVDDSYLTFIWNTLVEQPDVRVGLLKTLDPPPRHIAAATQDEDEGQNDAGADADVGRDAQDDAQSRDSDLKPLKKPRKRSLAQPSTTPTHELTIVPAATAALGYAHLASVYADQGQLRVLASPETQWQAITGSHARPTSLTPMVYQVLQMVSRGRGEGVTAVTLSRELGVDPKSVFHYIKVPHQLGIVEKISAIEHGSRTNRILHKRYLSVSTHWAVYTASEGGERGGRRDDDDDQYGRDVADDADRRGPPVLGQMSTITALYLSTNPELVRNRIVRALKQRGSISGRGTEFELEKCWMIHNEVASSIGLHSYSSTILRRLNAIINGLAQDGVVEKVVVTKKNRKFKGKAKGQVDNVSTIQALRLIDPDKLHRRRNNQGTSKQAQDDDDDGEDDHSYPLSNKSMPRQILDLLLEADTRGLTTNEICDALGHYTHRTIDATLQRLGRIELPLEWFDHSTTSLSETVGRMKQTRWFSLAGYVQMRRDRGVPDEKAEERWELARRAYEREFGRRRRGRGLDEDDRDDEDDGDQGGRGGRGRETGNDAPTDHSKLVATQYSTIEEKKAWLKKFKTMDHVGKGLEGREGTATSSTRGSGRGTRKPRGRPRGGGRGGGRGASAAGSRKGKEKAANQDDPDAGPDDEAAAADDSDVPVRTRGRPRKHAPVDGKESWYQRKKRLDAERLAQGLEVEETYYARKKREEKEDRERELEGLPPLVRERPKRASQTVKPKLEEDEVNELASNDSTPVPDPSTRKKRSRASTSETPGNDAEAPVPSSGASTVAKRKRGRPPKSAITVTSAFQDLLDAADRADRGDSEPVEQRPKKRARFSVATAAEEEASKEVETANTGIAQPTRRRGRSSGPPLVPGPELDGAPVRDPAPPPPPSTAPPTQTPPASAAASKRNSTSRASERAEEIVETRVESGSKTAHQAEDEKVAPSPPSPATLRLPASLSTEEAVGGPLPLEPPATSAPAPASTPSASSQALQPSQAQAKTKLKSRKSVTSKDNLTAISRQKEIMDYIEAQGGIIDAVPRLGKYMRAYNLRMNLPGSAFAMDRHVVVSTLSTLVKRERLRKTSAMGPKGDRHDIYYFPTISIDSPEMTSFLEQTLQKEKPARWDQFERARDLVIDDDDPAAADITEIPPPPGVDGDGGDGSQSVPTVIRPKPSDGPAEVKEYFRRQPNIVGASYGARYGAFSRARQLHKWLASFIFSGQHNDQFLAHSDDRGHILTHDAFVSAMPVVVFTSIVPLPVESDELRQFLANPDHAFLPLSRVPADILAILHPSLNKRKAAVWNAITILMMLELLAPLVESVNGRDRSFVAPPGRPQSATHWRFNTSAPVYAFAREDTPLVSIARLDSLEAVSEYWTAVQHLATVAVDELPFDDPATLLSSGFQLHFEGTKPMLTRLRHKSKWKDGYHLVPDQQQFLSDLVHTDPDLIDPNIDSSQELEQWADALYAPVDVVSQYLIAEERRARRALEVELHRATSSKRRRIRTAESTTAVVGEGAEASEWEDVPDGPAVLAAATALHRKVQEVARQRQRDWTTIVDKFRADHGHPDLDTAIVGYLERRFMDPRRQIDAVQLLFELRQLLPRPVETLPGDELLRTVVPYSLSRRARLAKDPYAVSRQPNIRKRVRAQSSKNAKPQRRASSTAASETPEGGRGQGGTSTQPIEYGDQNEFLSQPALPVPELADGRRTRHFYTSEQDELLLDAIAVLKARAQTLDSARLTFSVLERLFVGHKAKVLRVRSLVLLKKPEEQAYHDRLVEAWLRVYKERKARGDDDNLYDPNETSMSDFDIASFIRCLRENVDKRALRLTRTVTKPAAPSLTLPASLVALHTGYTVRPLASSKSSTSWDYYWNRAGIASIDRDMVIARAPLATSWNPSDKPFERVRPVNGHALALEREQALTAAAIKMVISSSDESYTPELGLAVLEPFAHRVDQVVRDLKNYNVIVSVSSELGRRIPGRNYSFHDKFFDKLNSTRITMERLADAAQFENDLTKELHLVRPATNNDDEDEDAETDPTSDFPIIPTEGEIMALIDLVSEGKVELSIDTSTLSAKTTRFDDFGTRQANDDDIECTVQIASTSATLATVRPPTLAPLPLPRTSLPCETTNIPAELDRAKIELFAHVDTNVYDRELVQTLLGLVETAGGIDGLSLCDLCSRIPTVPRSTVLSHLSVLVDPSLLTTRSPTPSPLVILTGFSNPPVYVSTRFVSSYAIPRPSPKATTLADSARRQRGVEWLEPCVWTGVDGVANREVWTRCTSFVRGLLVKQSGMTFDELRDKSGSMQQQQQQQQTLRPEANIASSGVGQQPQISSLSFSSSSTTTTTMMTTTTMSVPPPLLTTVELRVVLTTLFEHGIVEKTKTDLEDPDSDHRSSTNNESLVVVRGGLPLGGGGGGKGERSNCSRNIDWELDRWSLRGSFWSVGN